MSVKKKAVKKKPIRKKLVKKKPVKKKPIRKKLVKKDKLPTLEEVEKLITPAQKYFCERLIFRMGNLAAAYRDVYPNALMNTASNCGHSWINSPNVNLYYSLLRQNRSAENKIDTEYLIEKHKQIIDADVLEFYDMGKKKNFEFKHIRDFPKKYRWLIQEITPTVAGYRVKLLDKQKALAALGNISGIDRIEKANEETAITLSFDRMAEDF